MSIKTLGHYDVVYAGRTYRATVRQDSSDRSTKITVEPTYDAGVTLGALDHLIVQSMCNEVDLAVVPNDDGLSYTVPSQWRIDGREFKGPYYNVQLFNDEVECNCGGPNKTLGRACSHIAAVYLFLFRQLGHEAAYRIVAALERTREQAQAVKVALDEDDHVYSAEYYLTAGRRNGAAK